ncbi:hypothetical protein V7056_16265 [Bacillus sp. JJ664]
MKQKLVCLGSVSINYSAITEEQRKRLKRATEGLSNLQIRTNPNLKIKINSQISTSNFR